MARPSQPHVAHADTTHVVAMAMDERRDGFLDRVKGFLKRHGAKEDFPEAPDGVETWTVRCLDGPVGPSRTWEDTCTTSWKEGDGRSLRIATCEGKEKKTTGYLMRVFVEDVVRANWIHCDACRLAGWSHHPVCATRVHFVVGVEEKGNAQHIARTRKLCTACGRTIAVSSRTCPLCRSDTRNHAYLKCATHLLHGVVHGNGCGHLLRINGRQGGSMSLSGKQLMGLWDELCHELGVRQISVEDVSNWHGMEFRMLHLAAHGSTWYGRFGYKWARGSYGHTEDEWKRCTKIVQHFPLEHILDDLQTSGMNETELARTILHYRNLTKANTLGELLRGMIECFRRATLAEREEVHPVRNTGSMIPLRNEIPTLCRVMNDRANLMPGKTPVIPAARAQGQELLAPKHRARNGKRLSKTKRGRSGTAQGKTQACRWVPARVTRAKHAVVEALMGRKGAPISRQDLRDLVRTHIGDTGLLDHVLKTVGECTVGKFKVQRAPDPQTGVMQYSLVLAKQPGQEENKKGATGNKRIRNGTSEVGKKRKLGLLLPIHSRSSPMVPSDARGSPRGNSKDVLEAILLLYHQILIEYKPASIQRPRSTRSKGLKGQRVQECCRVLLDTKHFVKVYMGNELPSKPTGDTIRVRCCAHVVDMPPSLQPAFKRRRQPPTPQPPLEVITLPISATFRDLKRQAQSAFANIYPIFEAWQVKEIDGLRHVAGRTRVSAVLRDGATVTLRGAGVAETSTWRFETGLDHWVVRCSCGTTDDDGEHMLECERCGTWLHTRCLGIRESQAVPACFLCPDCSSKEPSSRSQPRSRS